MMNRTWIVVLSLVALAFGLGCSDPTAPSAGQVQVRLTDAPIDLSDVTAVNVTIESLELFEAGATDDEGTEMNRSGVVAGEGLTLNLLDFQNGESILIATLDVPAADYAKVRMHIASAELVRPDPNDPALSIVEPIFVPSGKVDIPVPFSVAGGETTDILFDFDAALSVQVNETPGQHQYILRPVIVPISIH
jgi:Domain of unknown function (DUF4382)